MAAPLPTNVLRLSRVSALQGVRLCSGKASSPQGKATKATQSTTIDKDAGGEYKAKQLYTYNPWSFYDIEEDMSKFRLKQPSSLQDNKPPAK